MSAHKTRRAGAAGLAIVSAMLFFTPAAAWSQTPINVPGARHTRPAGINSRGDIVGVYVTPDGRSHGFLLHDGEFTTIDVPGTVFTSAQGINPRGDIVGLFERRGFDF